MEAVEAVEAEYPTAKFVKRELEVDVITSMMNGECGM